MSKLLIQERAIAIEKVLTSAPNGDGDKIFFVFCDLKWGLFVCP